MATEGNIQVVKDFFAAIGKYDQQRLLVLVAEDIEWIILGVGWPLAATDKNRGPGGIKKIPLVRCYHLDFSGVKWVAPTPTPTKIRDFMGFLWTED